jgi:hypothetical protein
MMLATAGRPLHAEDFVQIAEPGFGDPRNAAAHSMAWFQGRLYVGTTHFAKDPSASTRDRFVRPERGFAGRGRDREFGADLGSRDQAEVSHGRAKILSYDPAVDEWRDVSPGGSDSSADEGYRGMVVFRGSGDDAPALYASANSSRGSSILRSAGGERFVRTTRPKVSGVTAGWSFRSLVPHRGHLHTTPMGRVSDATAHHTSASTPVVVATNDPVDGSWRLVSELGFGDPDNVSIFELATFRGYLYAGTFNPHTGFQVWKTRAEGREYAWERVISAGAYRGIANEAVVSMVPFGGALYVGTGIDGVGHDRAYDAGCPAELIRIHPDDSWDLVVGQPRRTPDGLKVPLSGMGPGFDNRFNSVIWRMTQHDGWLYLGTCDWSSFFATGQSGRRTGVLRRLVERNAGFDLWRSADGANWELVTGVGFGNPRNCGLRTMASTPAGLFLGTVTLRSRPRQTDGYRTEGAGGCEIWLGRGED